MNPLDFWRRSPLLAVLLLGAFMGGVLGLVRSIAPGPDQRSTNALEWNLPSTQVLSRFDEDRFTQVSRLSIWGATNVAGATRLGANGKPIVLPWHLTGIILEPEPMALVVANGASEVVRVAVGATLPDEALLISVSVAGIVYERDGCRYQRVLYAGDDAKQENECLSVQEGRDDESAPADSTPTQTSDSKSISGPKSNK